MLDYCRLPVAGFSLQDTCSLDGFTPFFSFLDVVSLFRWINCIRPFVLLFIACILIVVNNKSVVYPRIVLLMGFGIVFSYPLRKLGRLFLFAFDGVLGQRERCSRF